MQKILLALLLLIAIPVHAEDQQQSGNDAPTPVPVSASAGQATDEAVGFKLAPGVRGTAGIGAESIYQSNFYLNQDPKSAFGTVFTPFLQVVGQKKLFSYKLGANMEAAKYFNIHETANSYADGTVTGAFAWEAGLRHHFSGDATSEYGHDPFGLFRTEGELPIAGESLDKWIDNNAKLRYRFGADDAPINLETELAATTHRYQTNREFTQYLDYRVLTAHETAFFRVSSRTSLIAEAIHDDTSFYSQDPGTASLNGNDTHLRAGVHWLATAHTSGDIRVGEYWYHADDSTLNSVRALDWSAKLTWAPLVYSVFNLQTGVQNQQSYLADISYIQNRFVALDWTHDWTSAFKTGINFTHVNSDFEGSSRRDNANTAAFETHLRVSARWMWTAGTSYTRRSSNAPLVDYRNTPVYLGLRYQL